MQTNIKEDSYSFRNMNQVKSGNKPPDDGGEQNTMVNVEYVSCSLMVSIPTKEWDDIPSIGIMFSHTSSQEALQREPITDTVQKLF